MPAPLAVLSLKTTIALIASIALTVSASAIEYVKLSVDEPNPFTDWRGTGFDVGETLTVSATSLVGVVSFGFCFLNFNNRPDGWGEPITPSTPYKNTVLTGFTEYRAAVHTGQAGEGGYVILRITSAAENNAVTPSAVLVLPEESTGNFDLIIESSFDLMTWTPFFSQTVNSAISARFFRTRVTKSPDPVP